MLSPLQPQRELQLRAFRYWLESDVALTRWLLSLGTAAHTPAVFGQVLTDFDWGDVKTWSRAPDSDEYKGYRALPREAAACRAGWDGYKDLIKARVNASGLRPPSQGARDDSFWCYAFAHAVAHAPSRGWPAGSFGGMWSVSEPLPQITLGPYVVDPLTMTDRQAEIQRDMKAARDTFRRVHKWTTRVRESDTDRQVRFLFWRLHDGLSNKCIANREQTCSGKSLDESSVSRDIVGLAHRIEVNPRKTPQK